MFWEFWINNKKNEREKFLGLMVGMGKICTLTHNEVAPHVDQNFPHVFGKILLPIIK